MCVLPIHSVCQQTDQADNPDLRGQTHKQGLDRRPRRTLSASEQKYSVVNANIDYRRFSIQSRSRFQKFQLLNCVCVRVCMCIIRFCRFAPLPLLALLRLTVEILCCGAKALHLPVITSHPSLPRLFRVKLPVPPSAPVLHPVPSALRRHVVIMLSAPWALHLELVAKVFLSEQCCCCDACRLFLAAPWVAQAAGTLPNNSTFTRALTLPCLLEKDWQAMFK